jgi:site-specific DNA-methyltransferase (adenine-specific)
VDLPDLETQDEKKIVEDEYQMPEEIKTNIRPGDIFQIGRHRLLCGDSTNPEEVKKLMAGKKAGLVFTDPPYGVSYQGTDNGDGSKWTMIKNDDLRGDGLVRFLFLAFKNALDNTKKEIALYTWYAIKNHIQFETALLAAGWEVKQQLIWNKGMTLGHADYHWAHEPILYCKKQEQTTEWYGDRTGKTILRQRRTELTQLKKEELVQIIKNLLDNSTTWEIDLEKVVNYQHPTQKPVTLAGRAILNSSKENDIVLDLFLGSGSTMVAGEQADRKVYGMELDPAFCEVIVQRMKLFNPDLPIKKNKTNV